MRGLAALLLAGSLSGARAATYAPGNAGTFPTPGGGALTPLTGCISGVITTDGSGNAQCTPLAQFVIQVIPPGAPGILAAASGPTAITLTITPPNLNGGAAITGYMLAQGTAAGGEGTAAAIALTNGRYAVTGLTAGTAHYFKVAAVNSAGTGTYSAEASATTAAQ